MKVFLYFNVKHTVKAGLHSFMVTPNISQIQALCYAATKITEEELVFHPSSFTDTLHTKSIDSSGKKPPSFAEVRKGFRSSQVTVQIFA